MLAVGPAGILPADENSQPSEASGVSHRQDACAPFIHVLRPKSYD